MANSYKIQRKKDFFFKFLETNIKEHTVQRHYIHLWQSSKAFILYLGFSISNVATY